MTASGRRWLLVAGGVSVVLIGAFAVYALFLSGGDPVAEATTTTTTPTTVTSTSVPTTELTTSTTLEVTTTTLEVVVAPLTGLAVDDETPIDRRVVGVKIDNHSRARPQSGLDAADAVYEVVVEAGLTRFLALFHTTDTDYLGPMRSGRPTDASLMKPLGGVFVISGASYWISDYLFNQGIKRLGQGSSGAFRISSRSAPHNLYVSTFTIREKSDDQGISDDPPPPMWEFGTLPEEAVPASSVRIRFSPNAASSWIWIEDGYERSTSQGPLSLIDQEGTVVPFVFDGVIVLRVEQYTARPPRPSDGTPVPASQTVGSGEALVFAQEMIVEGRWQRQSDSLPFSLVTASGDVLTIPPGRYWIALVPTTGSVSWE